MHLLEHSPNVHEVRFEGVGPGWEKWILVQSDEHWDSPKCDRKLLKKHHDLAVERDALILKIGDTFCAMQGKYDPRKSKNDLREEHKRSDYLDALVETAADWYMPYRDRIVVIGYGNHETSIRNRLETDLLTRLTSYLRAHGGICRAGGYVGWVKWTFIEPRPGSKKGCYGKRWYYNHGWGGAAPSTKGIGQFVQLAEQIDGVDAILCGHNHWKSAHMINRAYLNRNNKIQYRIIHMLRCGTYKDEYECGGKSWHVERGGGPRPQGGYWCRFWYENKSINCEWTEAC